MRKFVLDCSATLAFFFQDETSAYVDAVFEALSQNAAAQVPPIWPLETANACLTRTAKTPHPRRNQEIFSILETFPIEVMAYEDLKSISNVHAIARTYSLSAYDAAYLELAIREIFRWQPKIKNWNRPPFMRGLRSGLPMGCDGMGRNGRFFLLYFLSESGWAGFFGWAG
jgi:predicted nucleic acid-binding protein